jgi:hypothetical protein
MDKMSNKGETVHIPYNGDSGKESSILDEIHTHIPFSNPNKQLYQEIVRKIKDNKEPACSVIKCIKNKISKIKESNEPIENHELTSTINEIQKFIIKQKKQYSGTLGTFLQVGSRILNLGMNREASTSAELGERYLNELISSRELNRYDLAANKLMMIATNGKNSNSKDTKALITLLASDSSINESKIGNAFSAINKIKGFQFELIKGSMIFPDNLSPDDRNKLYVIEFLIKEDLLIPASALIKSLPNDVQTSAKLNKISLENYVLNSTDLENWNFIQRHLDLAIIEPKKAQEHCSKALDLTQRFSKEEVAKRERKRVLAFSKTLSITPRETLQNIKMDPNAFSALCKRRKLLKKKIEESAKNGEIDKATVLKEIEDTKNPDDWEESLLSLPNIFPKEDFTRNIETILDTATNTILKEAKSSKKEQSKVTLLEEKKQPLVGQQITQEILADIEQALKVSNPTMKFQKQLSSFLHPTFLQNSLTNLKNNQKTDIETALLADYTSGDYVDGKKEAILSAITHCLSSGNVLAAFYLKNHMKDVGLNFELCKEFFIDSKNPQISAVIEIVESLEEFNTQKVLEICDKLPDIALKNNIIEQIKITEILQEINPSNIEESLTSCKKLTNENLKKIIIDKVTKECINQAPQLIKNYLSKGDVLAACAIMNKLYALTTDAPDYNTFFSSDEQSSEIKAILQITTLLQEKGISLQKLCLNIKNSLELCNTLSDVALKENISKQLNGLRNSLKEKMLNSMCDKLCKPDIAITKAFAKCLELIGVNPKEIKDHLLSELEEESRPAAEKIIQIIELVQIKEGLFLEEVAENTLKAWTLAKELEISLKGQISDYFKDYIKECLSNGDLISANKYIKCYPDLFQRSLSYDRSLLSDDRIVLDIVNLLPNKDLPFASIYENLKTSLSLAEKIKNEPLKNKIKKQLDTYLERVIYNQDEVIKNLDKTFVLYCLLKGDIIAANYFTENLAIDSTSNTSIDKTPSAKKEAAEVKPIDESSIDIVLQIAKLLQINTLSSKEALGNLKNAVSLSETLTEEKLSSSIRDNLTTQKAFLENQQATGMGHPLKRQYTTVMEALKVDKSRWTAEATRIIAEAQTLSSVYKNLPDSLSNKAKVLLFFIEHFFWEGLYEEAYECIKELKNDKGVDTSGISFNEVLLSKCIQPTDFFCLSSIRKHLQDANTKKDATEKKQHYEKALAFSNYLSNTMLVAAEKERIQQIIIAQPVPITLRIPDDISPEASKRATNILSWMNAICSKVDNVLLSDKTISQEKLQEIIADTVIKEDGSLNSYDMFEHFAFKDDEIFVDKEELTNRIFSAFLEFSLAGSLFSLADMFAEKLGFKGYEGFFVEDPSLESRNDLNHKLSQHLATPAPKNLSFKQELIAFFALTYAQEGAYDKSAKLINRAEIKDIVIQSKEAIDLNAPIDKTPSIKKAKLLTPLKDYLLNPADHLCIDFINKHLDIMQTKENSSRDDILFHYDAIQMAITKLSNPVLQKNEEKRLRDFVRSQGLSEHVDAMYMGFINEKFALSEKNITILLPYNEIKQSIEKLFDPKCREEQEKKLEYAEKSYGRKDTEPKPAPNQLQESMNAYKTIKKELEKNPTLSAKRFDKLIEGTPFKIPHTDKTINSSEMMNTLNYCFIQNCLGNCDVISANIFAAHLGFDNYMAFLTQNPDAEIDEDDQNRMGKIMVKSRQLAASQLKSRQLAASQLNEELKEIKNLPLQTVTRNYLMATYQEFRKVNETTTSGEKIVHTQKLEDLKKLIESGDITTAVNLAKQLDPSDLTALVPGNEDIMKLYQEDKVSALTFIETLEPPIKKFFHALLHNSP